MVAICTMVAMAFAVQVCSGACQIFGDLGFLGLRDVVELGAQPSAAEDMNAMVSLSVMSTQSASSGWRVT